MNASDSAVNPAPQPPPAAAPKPPFNEVSVLFPLLSLVTVAYLAMLVAEFFVAGLHVPGIMMPVYIALLGAYAADKEIRRWAGAAEPPRKGSLFVYLWVLVCLGLVMLRFFRVEYPVPTEMGKVVLQVLGIFFGSRASKYIHERRAAAALDPAELSARQDRILEIAKSQGKLTRADVMAALGLGRTTATLLLEDMVRSGLLRQAGSGRGVHYLPTDKPDKPEGV
jgi:uncharacterized membrane protein